MGRPLPDQGGGGGRGDISPGSGRSPNGEVAAEKHPRRHVSWAASEQQQPASFFRLHCVVATMDPRGTRYRAHLGGVRDHCVRGTVFLYVAQGWPLPQPPMAKRLDKEQVAPEGSLGTVEPLLPPPTPPTAGFP